MPPNKATREALLELSRGFEISQCIFTAAELKLADYLATAPQSCAALATATQTQSQLLERLLAILVDLGILKQNHEHFELTDMGQLLRSDTPNSLRDFLHMRMVQDYQAWAGLSAALKDGQSAFEHVFGMSRYDYLQQNPEQSRLFNQAMDNLSRVHSVAISAAYDFSSIRKLVDIGGGEGNLLKTLLSDYPNLQGALFELKQETLDRAQASMGETAARCEFMQGSFFEKIPISGDTFLLKHVLHNWEDEQAIQILQNCRAAMDDNARLLLVENKQAENPPLKAKLLHLRMLATMSGGSVRSTEDFRRILQAAGFRLAHIYPTPLEIGLFEAFPMELNQSAV